VGLKVLRRSKKMEEIIKVVQEIEQQKYYMLGMLNGLKLMHPDKEKEINSVIVKLEKAHSFDKESYEQVTLELKVLFKSVTGKEYK
jgi:hypothetical protein